MKTNHLMYKEMRELYGDLLGKNIELNYETIDRVFDLEKRSKLDLENLRDFIVCITVATGQDVLKARLDNDDKEEELELGKHRERCDLMTLLTDAISSTIYTNFG